MRKIEGGSAVSSVATRKEWQIVGGMHGGSMGVWDIRNYKKYWLFHMHIILSMMKVCLMFTVMEIVY